MLEKWIWTYLDVLSKEEQTFLHPPEAKRGGMGLLVPPFQGRQEPAKNTPSRVILREFITPFGTAHYRMAATPSSEMIPK